MRLLPALIVCAGLAACGGGSPPARFFTLGGEAAAGAAPIAAEYSIVVGPVTIPELVDRPQLVVRSSANRVDILEQARWAAPLESEIPRVLAAELARILPDARTASSAQRAATTPDYRVAIDVQRFDTTPNEGAAIEALWSVRPTTGAPVTGRSSVREPAGAAPEDLVAAHSRALSAVARDIAASITALRQSK